MNVTKLKNGITVITDQVPSANSACIGFFVKAGAIDEDETNYGISHIIEHMMFKGTETRNAQQISRDFDQLGISINAFTGEEYTCYYGRTLPENLIKTAEIFSDMLMNSVFDKEELQKELMVIIEEYKMYRNNPNYHARSLFSTAFNKGTSYEVDIIGTEESITSTTREKIIKYIETHYCNEKTTVCVSGKFNELEILNYLEKNFTLGHSNNQRVVNVNFEKPAYVSVKEDTEQSYIYMGTHAFSEGDERAYALMILSELMGGSMSSRLFVTIREEQGLAYSVHSYADLMSETGSFIISAGVSNDKVEQAVKSIVNEIKKLKEHSVSEEEFLKAKNILKSSLIFSYESLHNRMVEIGSSKLLLNKDVNINELAAKIDAVTYEDVVAVAEIINDHTTYSCLVYSDKEHNIEELMK